MNMIETMKNRRSIRKYAKTPVEQEKLELIMEAGLYAPNPGGRQGTKIIILNDPELIEKVGVVNASCENRNWGTGVSSEQPSIIDDLSIKSGFYGAPALAMVCVNRERRTMVNQIGSAFVCAENMVLEAYDLGLGSCIVGRAEATFNVPEMQSLLDEWGLDPAYIPMVFVCIGYTEGKYPAVKPRNEGRSLFVNR